MTHLTSDELIDAMEGMLAAERQAHLATCEQCRHELAGLSSVLNEAKQASAFPASTCARVSGAMRSRTNVPRTRSVTRLTAKVITSETPEVSQTSAVSGASKFILSALP